MFKNHWKVSFYKIASYVYFFLQNSAVYLHLAYEFQLFVYIYGTNVRICYLNKNRARFARTVVK